MIKSEKCCQTSISCKFTVELLPLEDLFGIMTMGMHAVC